MPIAAKVIEDSISWADDRLTTMQLRYPRIIHAEAKTHRLLSIDDVEIDVMHEISLMDDRDLSRNASSSRAIPVMKLIEEARTNPAMPVRFGANQSGMQDKGSSYNEPLEVHTQWGFKMMDAEEAWRFAAHQAADLAESFMEAGYHKQVANRLLEPFTHINVVVTATDWVNFFALRCHPDADPTMRALAEAMREAYYASVPRRLDEGEWHVPYVSAAEREAYSIGDQLIMSSARCARVSYNKHDGTTPSLEDDRKLYDVLVTSELVHASPTEHQGTPDPFGVHKELWGNLTGFIQHRKTIPNERIS